MPRRKSSLKNGCFWPKAGNAKPSFALGEVGWEPVAGKDEGKEGGHWEGCPDPASTVGSQDPAKSSFDTTWMILDTLETKTT